MPVTQVQPPSDDRRWRAVEARMRRLGGGPDALIEVLHAVQDAFGFLDVEALAYVSDALRVPPAKVYGVATFYSYFTLEPGGDHTCVVCTGTACHMEGAAAILAAIGAAHGVAPGGTSEDGHLSLLAARCLGVCSLAPVMVLDGEPIGRLTPESALARIASLPAGARAGAAAGAGVDSRGGAP